MVKFLKTFTIVVVILYIVSMTAGFILVKQNPFTAFNATFISTMFWSSLIIIFTCFFALLSTKVNNHTKRGIIIGASVVYLAIRLSKYLYDSYIALTVYKIDISDRLIILGRSLLYPDGLVTEMVIIVILIITLLGRAEK